MKSFVPFFHFQFCLEIFENSKQRDDHTCDGIENTGQQIICHKHPEKGPMIFTTQEQLFAHFAKEHVDSNLNLETRQDVSTDENKDYKLDKTIKSISNTNTEKRCESGATIQETELGAKSCSELGTQQPQISKLIIASTPQLQHSCPVCHKVGKQSIMRKRYYNIMYLKIL